MRIAGAREAVGPDLAHADAVTPAAAREGEARDAARFVERAVDDEELLAQAKRRADSAPAHRRRRSRAADCGAEHAPRNAAASDAQVKNRADRRYRAREAREDFAGRERLGRTEEHTSELQSH